jgi:hypothetical protein
MELSFAIVALLFAVGNLARVKPTAQLFRFNCGGSFERGFLGWRSKSRDYAASEPAHAGHDAKFKSR